VGQIDKWKTVTQTKRLRDSRSTPVSHATVPDRTDNGSKANHRAGDCTYSSSEVRKRVRVCPYNSLAIGSRHHVGGDRCMAQVAIGSTRADLME
jgi:hypothetical protein